MNLIFRLQGAQSTDSPPFSSVLAQNITTAAEQWTSRSASLGQDLPTDSDRHALTIVGVY